MKKYLIIILTTICALLLTLFAFLLLVPNGISIPGLHIAKKVSAPTNSYWTRLADQKQKAEEQKELKRLTEGNIRLSPEELLTYGDVVSCSIQENKETVTLSLSLPDIPGSDDADIYLFALETYESEAEVSLNERTPVSQARKSISCEFEWNYSKEMLFQHFVPALLLEGNYVPIATGNYINNPEMIASNCDNYPESTSKKGLLIDPFTLGTPEYDKLGIKYVIYNIPFSHILGETTDDAYPTINYEYQGTTYLFNGLAIAAYDNLFQTLTDNNQIVTAIVLDDWNEIYPEAIHPQSRNKNPDAYYYAMNTADAEGCRLLQAVASFLTERYSSGEYGLVSSWVIGNEINQQKIWNYMDTDDISYYASEYEKSLRIFYNAAKSNYANAKVSLSIDHDWNDNKGKHDEFFNGKDLLGRINLSATQKGNYDWGIAIHPYPNPLTRVNYWRQTYDKSVDAPLLTLMNLRTITDYIAQDAFLDRAGNMRNLTVTELGFSSASGEKLQAAAVAYCYYIIEANPHIEAFIMNRQTDALEEIREGLAFGIYEMDRTPKYLYDVFCDMDTERRKQHEDFILNILGAESMEEALSWAE